MTIRRRSNTIRAALLAPQRVQCASTAPSPATINLDAEIPTFSGVAYSGGPMYPKGWEIPLVIDLQGLAPLPASTAVDREHNRELVVGNTKAYSNSGRSILCSGVFSGSDTEVIDTTRKARAAGTEFPWFLSIDADIEQGEPLPKGQTAMVNGQQITGPAIIARRSTGRTLSFVLRSGDPKAKASVQAASAAPSTGNPMTFEEWLASIGFTDPTALTDAQRTGLQSHYDEMQAAAGEDMAEADGAEAIAASSGQASTVNPGRLAATAVNEMRQGVVAEMTRQREIRRVCEASGNPVFKVQGKEHNLAEFAIEQGWPVMQAELEAVRESRPKAPSGAIRDVQCSCDALVCSLLMSSGVRVEEPLPARMQVEAGGSLPAFLFAGINSDAKQQILASAHTMRGMNSLDVARMAMRIDGKLDSWNPRVVIEAASTGSFSNVISTTAFVKVLDTFNRLEDPTAEWCAEDMQAANFLPTKDVGLVRRGGTLAVLPPGKTARESTLSDTGEVVQVRRHAEQFNVDEQTLINDQLGQILAALGEFGEVAAETRPALVFAILLRNAAMADGVALFHATHGNLQASSALAEATLASAIGLLRKAVQTGADGKSAILNVKPTHLLVPAALEFTGSGLTSSVERRAASATGGTTENPFSKLGIKTVADARLDLGLVDPLAEANTLTGSASTWFLLSAEKPAIKVSYLRSSGRSPQIRTTPLAQGRWGTNIDVAFDIGVSATRYQTAVKSTG